MLVNYTKICPPGSLRSSGETIYEQRKICQMPNSVKYFDETGWKVVTEYVGDVDEMRWAKGLSEVVFIQRCE